jgi:alanine racemase
MGRIGCRPGEAAALAASIGALKSLSLEGTATHLAVSDSTAEEDILYTKKQLALFREAVESIKNTGLDPGIIHAANTGAVTFHADSFFNMVRPGILLYGYAPAGASMAVEPVMEVDTRIVFIKRVRKGESLSYGRTWTAPEDTVIATLPIGYGDGFPRLLSGDHSVLIGDRLYPLAGRICMDQCMVNLGPDSTVQRWETVTVFGGGPAVSGAAAPHAGDLAAKLRTIPYEITCNINKRVPRVYSSGAPETSGGILHD